MRIPVRKRINGLLNRGIRCLKGQAKEETHGVEGWNKEGKLTWRLKKTVAKVTEENPINETPLEKKGQSHKGWGKPKCFKQWSGGMCQ
jgi:hypothetical protein